jgi:hypothetical protein
MDRRRIPADSVENDPKPTLKGVNYCIAKGYWQRPDQPSISVLPDRINSKKPIPRYRNVC